MYQFIRILKPPSELPNAPKEFLPPETNADTHTLTPHKMPPSTLIVSHHHEPKDYRNIQTLPWSK